MDEQMIARAIGECLHKCGVFKEPPGNDWTDGPCLLAARAAHSVIAGKVAELTELLVRTQDTIREAADGGEPHFGDLWRAIDAALAHPKARNECHD